MNGYDGWKKFNIPLHLQNPANFAFPLFSCSGFFISRRFALLRTFKITKRGKKRKGEKKTRVISSIEREKRRQEVHGQLAIRWRCILCESRQSSHSGVRVSCLEVVFNARQTGATNRMASCFMIYWCAQNKGLFKTKFCKPNYSSNHCYTLGR